jgi:hypothetical protein
VIVFLFIQDITQKEHALLRNYPVIGRLRYFFEKQGEYFRQYFFAGDRDEMPFNRATRAWVYRVAKKEDGEFKPATAINCSRSNPLPKKKPRLTGQGFNCNWCC